jgi:hypothetical protein
MIHSPIFLYSVAPAHKVTTRPKNLFCPFDLIVHRFKDEYVSVIRVYSATSMMSEARHGYYSLWDLLKAYIDQKPKGVTRNKLTGLRVR